MLQRLRLCRTSDTVFRREIDSLRQWGYGTCYGGIVSPLRRSVVNQVSYAFSMAESMQPFQQLLKPSKTFTWDDQLDNIFNESKSIIIKEIEDGVKIFDKKEIHLPSN